MGEEEIPRRLRRFHRKEKKALKEKYGFESNDLMSDNIYSQIKEQGEKELSTDKRKELVNQILSQAKGKVSADETIKVTIEEVKKFKQKHRRAPKEEEYDKIAENIFKQLQKSKEQETKTRGKPATIVSNKPIQETKPLTSPDKTQIKDLFGELDKELGSGITSIDSGDSGNNELTDLEKIGGEEELNLLKEDNDACPNCKKEANKIIYCP
ncbi:MAG: hypothetical protein ABH821_01005, partial [archaeon]